MSMSKEKAISPEELGEATEEADANDRRDFLKTAAQAAGAMAIFSVAGALIGDEAMAQDDDEPVQARPASKTVRNMKMNIVNKSNSRQISFSGQELGKALQAQGLIPSDVSGAALNRASIIFHFEW
jgi:hypothetical protein